MTSTEKPADERGKGLTWDDLGFGAPTIIAYARLASNALVNGSLVSAELSPHAKTILYAARQRGVLDVRATNHAFDATDRFLYVYVEVDADHSIAFKSKEDPRITVAFLDGFRQLCAAGLLMHHLSREFSLTVAGFELAQQIPREEVESLLALGVELGRHEW